VEAAFRSWQQQPRVILAKNKRQKFDSPQSAHGSAAIVDAKASANASANAPARPARAADLFYLTDLANNPALVTETVFVVVEGSNPGSTGVAAYRISVWRVVIQKPSGNPSPNTIPHKET
jgi:hypothetical protein